MVQQLLHLGVGELLVVDPDTVAVSNLSRLVGAGLRDARRSRPKVKLARRLARCLGSETRLRLIQGSITEADVGRRLLDCDVIVGCTDNQWSRTVLNQIAHQYYVPVLDLGVELQPGGAMGGRVSWLAPGSACLWCAGILDAAQVRAEQTAEQGGGLRLQAPADGPAQAAGDGAEGGCAAAAARASQGREGLGKRRGG